MESAEVNAHVVGCAICSKANKRVNDFCPAGRLLFAEYAKTHQPTGAREVEITDEQFERLVAEQVRSDKASEQN